MDILRQKIFDDRNEQFFIHCLLAQAFSGFNLIDRASVRGDRIADAASLDLVKRQTIKRASCGDHDGDTKFCCILYCFQVAFADAAFFIKKRTVQVKRNEFDIFHVDTFLIMR